MFLDDTAQRSVKTETLLINDEVVFERTNKVKFGDFKKIRDYISTQAIDNVDTINLVANQSLLEDELFLSNGFKLLISQSMSKIIVDWFTEKFMVIYRADAIQLIRRFSDPQKKTIFVEKIINEAAKAFGINSNSVAKDPLKRAKSLSTTTKTEIYHFSDYESDEEIHVKQFKDTLEDVIKAVERSEKIMGNNVASGYVLQRYKGFSYYKENPSLAVWEAIKKILKDCKLI